MFEMIKGVFTKKVDPRKPDEERKLYAIHIDSDISEWKLFHMAYVSWYGREGNIEYDFDNYMFEPNMPIPVYVRHFMRKYKFTGDINWR